MGLRAVFLFTIVVGFPRAGEGATCTLRDLAGAAGVHIGAGFVEGRDDPRFRDTLAREFNSVTAPLYWVETHPTAATYDFTVADDALAIAEANGLRVRGHPLVWGRLALPDYVRNTTDPTALRALMADHIQTLVGHYAGRIAQYDVVNEPLTLLGAPGTTDGLDPSVFLQVLGPGYVREALDLAHAADPAAQLFINDFFVMAPGAKQERFFRLAKDLVESGTPLHGVGFQGHIHLPIIGTTFEPTAVEIEAAIARFAALGLAVEVTELDVTIADHHPCRLDAQREIYERVLGTCFASAACRGVTTWAISDAFTWIRDFFGVDGAPLLFDESFQPKPAYFGARDALWQAVVERGTAGGLACTVPPGPARPSGCCTVDADCGGDACIAGRTCDDHVCTAGSPVVCDDGDPCTVDACGRTEGCRSEPVAGFEAARCTCDRALPPACEGAEHTAGTASRVGRACMLLGRAKEASGRRRTSRLLAQAARQLGRTRAQALSAGRRGRISSACADALAAQISDARERVRRVRREGCSLRGLAERPGYSATAGANGQSNPRFAAMHPFPTTGSVSSSSR